MPCIPFTINKKTLQHQLMSNDVRDLLGISAYLFLNTCEYVKEVLSFHMNGSSNTNLCLYTKMVDVKIGRNSKGARGNYLL